VKRLSDVARSLRAVQGSPAWRDQVIGCPFFGSFLWASKEMNNKQQKTGMNFSFIPVLLMQCQVLQSQTS